MFPAEGGDAFLLRLDNKKNILIDMGYSDTYTSYIKNRLIQLKEQKECIDLLVITHIDEDHIEGAIEFLHENGMADNPNIIEVKEIWHNSYRFLQFKKEKVDKITRSETKKLDRLIISKLDNNGNKLNGLEGISCEQGSTFAGLLYGLGYEERWNTSYNHKAVNIDDISNVILGDITINLLSPDTEKLNRLSNIWNNKLEDMKFGFQISDEEIFDDAFEMYVKKVKPIIEGEKQDISYSNYSIEEIINKKITRKTDTSESNGASISFVIKYKEKKLLFLGDAHEKLILDSLNKYNEMDSVFDVVKVSHHGSIKNNFKWIKKLKTKRYLISTDGKQHNHPSKETIATVLKENKENKILYFNYPLEVCDELKCDKLKEEYKYSLVVGNGKTSVVIEVN
ncbi:MBL fold metallo-hydrolase [Clostridium butyricum]|nr:MBL fold metallo-hydrolase [Clostridium sp.]